MIRNRIILISVIIITTIYVSLYGGSISYGFFYLALFTPVIAYIYTLYVYLRFRLYQDIGQRVIIKGDLIPYFFTLANEDYITFKSIKVNFLQDKSHISGTDNCWEYSLLPGTSKELESKLKCYYRGEYYVGVSSVEITDFLYLFKIRYPIQSKLKVTVLPRVVRLKQVGFLPPRNDEKNANLLTKRDEDIMDVETRKYQAGDGIKQIHWKTSAKRNELFTRKYSALPKLSTTILMDLSPVNEEEDTKLVIEDLIIECSVALANYYKEERVKCQIIYELERYCSNGIKGHADFERFYNACVNMHFRGSHHFSDIFKTTIRDRVEDSFYILITHTISEELYKNLLESSGNMVSLAVIIINDNYKDLESMIQGLKVSGVYVKQITCEDKIEEVLAL
ncbi:MAG: hypothetical protein K0S61_1199 [Anaerocolumna sp.]|jgi:hypothetical protein|nr:hypothetical protein [Anaerocolumna sp.]